MSKVLVLGAYDDNYARIGLGQLSADKNREYAERHGYDIRFNHEDLRSHYFFHKFHLLTEVLPNYDYVLWVDADAFVVRHDLPAEIFFPQGDAIMSACIDNEYLNTGIFVIKNDLRSLELCRRVTTIGPQLNHPFPDAKVIADYFEEEPQAFHRITPQKSFNAYKYELYAHRTAPNPDGEFELGYSFAIHFPGMPLVDRVAAYHRYNVKEMH